MDSRHKKKFSLQPLSPPRFEEKPTEVPEVPAKLEIPPNHTPQWGSVTLPIFVYDCKLSSLIEVLVYKESEEKPADIYEDHLCGEKSEDRKENDDDAREAQQNLVSPEPKSDDSDVVRGSKMRFYKFMRKKLNYFTWIFFIDT